MQGEIVLRLTNRAMLLVLALLGFVWVLTHQTHIIVVLFIALLLAAACSTAANRLARYRIKRGVSIALIYLLIIGALIGVGALIVPLLRGEGRLLRENLPAYQLQLDGFLARLPHQGEPLQINDVVRDLSGRVQGIALDASRTILGFGSSLITLLLIFVIGFFLAVDDQLDVRLVNRLLPPAIRPRAIALMGRMGTGLGHWVRGQLLLALFFGVAFDLGLAIVGTPYALTLGTIGAVLEIIPYVGGFITIALALLVAATTGKVWLVVFVLIWYLLVVNLESHLVAPKLVGELVGLHPLMIVIALFLGAELLGVLGALLAVPIAVIFQTLLDEFWIFPESDAAAPTTPAEATPASVALQPGVVGAGLAAQDAATANRADSR